MFAVRYVALVMLVLWLSAMIDQIAGFHTGDMGPLHAIGYPAGVTIALCFIVIKLVGPPPHAFVARLAIVILMLLLAGYADVMERASMLLTSVNAALGFVLLLWYVRE